METTTRTTGLHAPRESSRSHAPRGNARFDAPRRLPPRATRSVEDGVPTRSVGTRSLTVVVRIALLLLFTMVARAEESPRIRHIFVPVEKPELWPKDVERTPIPFDDYVQLRESNQPPRPARLGAHIEWQSLSATFEPARGLLTDGRWSAEVRGIEKQSRLMSLEPLDLPISELKWSDGEALWGTAPSGATLVLVDAAERRLEGRFSRQGRRLQRTWQFDLRLATATVSELKLRVPAKYSLKCSAGLLRGPLTSGEEGWRQWQVHLGGQSHCELLIVDTPAVAPTEPVVVFEQTSSYVLREAEVEVQCEVNAEIFHTPKATLAFNVPNDLSIYSIGVAGDSRLNWRELPRVPGQLRQVEVTLPEPQIGRVRALQLLGGATAKWEPSFALPHITLANGWFVTGRWNVSVDAPLVWRGWRPTGLRMIDVNATSPTSRRLSFTQYLADASLGLDIAIPEARLTSHGLQRLTARETTWRLTSEWLWQSNSGAAFAARCRIPVGWEVLDVQSLPESADSEVRHWDVVKDTAGEQTLVIDFTTPLEGQATHRIQMVARRPRGLAAERDSFELPTPLDCRHSEQLLIVQAPIGWRWDGSDAETVPAATASKRLGSPWLDFELWKADAPTWTASTLLSRATQIDTPLRPLAAFVPDVTQPASAPAQPIEPTITRATSANGSPIATDAAFREAATEQLIWTTAELRSLIFPGGDGDDAHVLSLRTAQVARVGRLEFELPAPAELVAVRMNGVRTEPERDDRRFRLPAIPQGGLQTLEIQYRVPSDRDFLRNRQSLPVPRVEAPVLGFRWLFAFPPDARLTEEPSGLRLLQPLEPTPWSRRLFGPLGRDESATWFNPFSDRDWSELWNPPEEGTSDEKTPESLFAPPGWRVREAIAATLPTEITWLTWSGSQVRVLAWIGMLLSVSIGCVLRVRRAKPRVHIAAFWLGLCGVGVVLSAPVYAEALGGCFVGAMIAALIPRRLVMSYANQREAAGRGAFETTVAFQQVVGAMIVSAIILSSAFAAQEPPIVADSSAQKGETFDVLIPVDSPNAVKNDQIRPSDKLPLAFVPKLLLKHWRDRQAAQAEPTSLIESARYEVDWSSSSVRAEFVVHRLRPREPLTLRFPFVTVPLAGANACTVDGQPRPVIVNETRDALLLELPAMDQLGERGGVSPPVSSNSTGGLTPNGTRIDRDNSQPERASVRFDAGLESEPDASAFRLIKVSDIGLTPPRSPVLPQTHRVVFSLLPPIKSEDNLQRLTLDVPSVLASHVVVKSQADANVESPSRRGESQANSAAGAWTAQLGKSSNWSLELLPAGATRPRAAADLKADVSCFTELTPTAMRQRYRVRYTVLSGEVHDVSWLLPRSVLLRDGEVTADHLLHWIVEPQADGRQRLILEFNQPQTGEFVVDVTGLQPPLGTLEHPHWEPWTIDAGGSVAGAKKLALGVTSLSGFKVSPPPVDVERIASLNEAAFVKGWGAGALVRQPQVTLQVLTPSELEFAVVPLAPQRKVRQELLLKIGRQAFEWALYSEVATAGSPAFQHEVLVAPHFRADEVSITEDEAERLVSWSQHDQKLSLFLRDSTTGIQNVVLQGRDAVPADGRLLIPTRWFADAELADFTLRVTHDPSWHIELFDEKQQPLYPTDPGGPVPDQTELFLGKFRLDLKALSLDVRLTPHQPAGHAAGWTQISQSAAESWSWRHIERWLDDGQITARVFWPAAWATSGSMTLSPSLKELARRPLPDGIELTVQSLPDVDGPREILFESQPAVTLNSASSPLAALRVTSPTSLDVTERAQHWLISDDLLPWLPTAIAAATRSFEDANNLPDKLPRTPSDANSKWLSLSHTLLLELTPPAPTAAAPSPKMLWMETTVWVANGAITQGRTWLLLQPNGLREFLLDRPDDIHWIAAYVGDSPRELPAGEAATQRLVLDDLPNDPLVWMSVFWRIESAQRDRIVARRDAQLPLPAEASLRPPRHDLTLISSGHSDLSSTRGARRVQDWDARLARAEQIFRALPSYPAAMNASLRRLWELADTDLTEARQAIEKQQPVGQVGIPPSESAKTRLEAILADATVVRSRLTPATSSSSPVPHPESWTSDAWRNVPNSWTALADLDQSARLAVIVLNRRWLTWLVALLAASVVIPLIRVWLRWQTGEWLARHPHLAWACLGIIWWTCLAPSLIGLGLLVVATLTAIRQRWWNSQPDFILSVPNSMSRNDAR